MRRIHTTSRGIVLDTARRGIVSPLKNQQIRLGVSVGYELDGVEVVHTYDNRTRDYRWEAEGHDGGDGSLKHILDARAMAGWDLVSACVDSYRENNTMMEATSYRLFFRRERDWGMPR
jgi:hypothetical protein